MTPHERARAIVGECSCLAFYAARQLTDPECGWCKYANAIAAALEAETAATTEACARVADALHDRELHLTPEERIGDGSLATARTIAAAIRQRKGARHE